MPNLCRLLKDETFADARYVMELLRQTFAALDRANRELGYVHRFAAAPSMHICPCHPAPTGGVWLWEKTE